MESLLARVEAALREHFAQQPARASVSFVGVDPIEVLRFEPVPGEYAYVSLGMSRHPMTGAEADVLQSIGPRAELLLQVREDGPANHGVWRRLAVLAAAPAVEGLVYRDGATVGLGEAWLSGSTCTGAVVTAAPLSAVVADDGTAVEVFELLPATENELAWARIHGGAALLQRWLERGTDLRDLVRQSVELG